MATNGEQVPFCSQIRASGLAEVWTHNADHQKFGQFGWRCTNKENSYSNDTLVGNWNEQRFDLSRQRQAKPLPSQYAHYFETTYRSNFNEGGNEVPRKMTHMKARGPHAHPGHQPELDSDQLKAVYNGWETSSRAAYLDPRLRTAPVREGSAPGGRAQPQ